MAAELVWHLVKWDGLTEIPGRTRGFHVAVKTRITDPSDDESTPGRTRTCNLRIRSLPTPPLNPEENADFPKVGALGAAVETEIGISDPDLAMIVRRWDSLPEAVRAGIVAMVGAAAPKMGRKS